MLPFFDRYDLNLDTIYFNVTEFNVGETAKQDGEFTMTFPLFSNNDDVLCPLSYRLSVSDQNLAYPSNLPAPEWDSEITLLLPLDILSPLKF